MMINDGRMKDGRTDDVTVWNLLCVWILILDLDLDSESLWCKTDVLIPESMLRVCILILLCLLTS